MCLITDQVLLAPTLAESNPQTARGIDSTQHDSLNIITFHAQVNKKPSITSIFAIPNEWLDIQNMLSLSDKVIISQFKWNFRKRTDFCLPLWKARYLQHNAAVRAMVPQRQLLIYKVLVQGDFFHPPKRYKKVILCKGDQNSQLDFRSAKVGRSCALSWANLSLTPRGLTKTSILDPI